MNDSTGSVAPMPNGGKKKKSLLAIGGLGLLGIVVIGFIIIIGSCCCAAFVFQLGANSTSDTYSGVTYSPTSTYATNQPSSQNSIVGVWRDEDSSDGEYYQFFQDGTFFYEGFYPPAYYESGNWKSKGNGVYIITPTKQGYDSANLVKVIGPISSEYTLNGDKLTHSSGNYYYTRYSGAMPTPAPYVSPTPVPTLSPDEIKSQAKSVSYRELLTNSDAYFGDIVKVSGKVIQVQKSDGGWLGSPYVTYLVGMDDPKNEFNYINQIVMFQFEGTGGKIMEGDKVDLYGYAEGTTKYTTVLGAENEVPYIEYLYGVYYT